MNLLRILLQIISIYQILVLVRILFSWLGNFEQHRILGWVYKLVDPYLNIFKRIRFLRIGILDLSPLLAIGILYLVQNILVRLSSGRSISFLGILFSIGALLIDIVLSLIFIVIIVLIIRLLILLFSPKSRSNFVLILDQIVRGIVTKVMSFITRKTVSFRTALYVSIILFILLYTGLRYTKMIMLVM